MMGQAGAGAGYGMQGNYGINPAEVIAANQEIFFSRERMEKALLMKGDDYCSTFSLKAKLLAERLGLF